PARPGVGSESTGEAGGGGGGGAPAPATTIRPVFVTVFEPPGPLAVRLTVKVPAVAYVCVGLVRVEVPPSPKLHDREVIAPVEASVNTTLSGAVPLTGAALNAATGGGCVFRPRRLKRFVETLLTPGPPTFGPSMRNTFVPAGLPVIV